MRIFRSQVCLYTEVLGRNNFVKLFLKTHSPSELKMFLLWFVNFNSFGARGYLPWKTYLCQAKTNNIRCFWNYFFKLLFKANLLMMNTATPIKHILIKLYHKIFSSLCELLSFSAQICTSNPRKRQPNFMQHKN